MFIALLCIKCYYKINNLKGSENFAECTDESQEKLQSLLDQDVNLRPYEYEPGMIYAKS